MASMAAQSIRERAQGAKTDASGHMNNPKKKGQRSSKLVPLAAHLPFTLKTVGTGEVTEEPTFLHFQLPTADGSGQAETRCRFLFQKRLSASDMGPLGRVVLPRAASEAFLPRLPDRRGNGTALTFLDVRSGQQWTFQYNFWPNHSTRMYVLEGTGGFTSQAVKNNSSRNPMPPVLALYRTDDGRLVCDMRALQANF